MCTIYDLPLELFSSLIFPAIGKFIFVTAFVCRGWRIMFCDFKRRALGKRKREDDFKKLILPRIDKKTNVPLSFLKWAFYENDCFTTTCLKRAAKNEDWKTVKWLISKQAEIPDKFDYSNVDITGAVAEEGNLDMLKRLHRRGVQITDETAVCAASGGNLKVFQWVIEKKCAGGKHCFSRLGSAAIKAEQINILVYLCEEFLWVPTGKYIELAVRTGALNVLKWIHACFEYLPSKRMFPLAAAAGHIHILEWMENLPILYHADTFKAAALAGQIDTMEWLMKRKCKKALQATSESVAFKGVFTTLVWLANRGVSLNGEICADAARGAHLDILIWLRGKGCSFSSYSITAAAASIGNLVILRWLKNIGCPWDEDTCASAAGGGHLDVLKWLRARGCPWDSRTANRAWGKNSAIFAWVINNGCPYEGLDEEVYAMEHNY